MGNLIWAMRSCSGFHFTFNRIAEDTIYFFSSSPIFSNSSRGKENCRFLFLHGSLQDPSMRTIFLKDLFTKVFFRPITNIYKYLTSLDRSGGQMSKVSLWQTLRMNNLWSAIFLIIFLGRMKEHWTDNFLISLFLKLEWFTQKVCQTYRTINIRFQLSIEIYWWMVKLPGLPVI